MLRIPEKRTAVSLRGINTRANKKHHGICNICLTYCLFNGNKWINSNFRSIEFSLYLTSRCCCRIDGQVFSSSSQNLLLGFWSLFFFVLLFISFWQAELGGMDKMDRREEINYYFVFQGKDPLGAPIHWPKSTT